MKRLLSRLLLIALCAATATIYGGHEMPVYPSYYPQEIQVVQVEPRAAARLLLDAKIHAYVSDRLILEKPNPKTIGYIDSLGTYLLLTVNRASALLKDRDSACDIRDRLLQTWSAAQVEGFEFHPYPINPFHGDYLQHYDRAQTARARYNGVRTSGAPKIALRAEGSLATELVGPQSNGAGWDAIVTEVPVSRLVESQHYRLDGWLGPPWSKRGWFHAYLLLGDSLRDSDIKQRVEIIIRRLRTGDYQKPEQKLNLERELISLLIHDCYTTVFGYTAKRQYFNADFSAGIENIAYDSHAGLNSAIFIRTVKLKDFPWNGWLRLGTDTAPTAAWNPIAGFSDDAGQLIWWALGDPGLFPAPYADGWELNRIIDAKESQ